MSQDLDRMLPCPKKLLAAHPKNTCEKEKAKKSAKPKHKKSSATKVAEHTPRGYSTSTISEFDDKKA